MKKIEKTWMVEYLSWGRYAEDGESHSFSGPYTESEAKEIVDAVNKREELKNLLQGIDAKDQSWYFQANVVKLEPDNRLPLYLEQIKGLEEKVAELNLHSEALEQTSEAWTAFFDDESLEEQLNVSLAEKLTTKVNRWARRCRETCNHRLIADFS